MAGTLGGLRTIHDRMMRKGAGEDDTVGTVVSPMRGWQWKAQML